MSDKSTAQRECSYYQNGECAGFGTRCKILLGKECNFFNSYIKYKGKDSQKQEKVGSRSNKSA
jgi:hypothetical protein